MKYNISLLKVKYFREFEKILENLEKNYKDFIVNN